MFKRVKKRYQAWTLKIVKITSDEDDLQKTKEDELVCGKGWDRLGFHRPVANYFYTFGLMVPELIFAAILLPFLQYTAYRYPEISSFEVVAGGIFGALYSIFDLETEAMIKRFVPEYAISNPRKAMQFVTFFVKYQMWSGLIQILGISLFMFFYIIPYTNFAYLAWFILFINIKQYPAILNTFKSIISSLQHGDKENLIHFYRASVLEPITQIVFGLIGLYWGQNNPEFGEMYGLALGWAIGGYIDDFLTFILGMHWLSKILDKYNITMREVYGQKVPKEVWKEGMNYSMRLWPKAIFRAIRGFFGFMLTYQSLPGYLTYQGIIREAERMRKVVSWSDDIINKSQAAYSESFNNGKKNLTRFYIGQGLKYNSLFFMILGPINIICLPMILDVMFEGGYLPDTWRLIGQAIPIMVIIWSWTPLDDIAKKMIYLSGHPEVNTVLEIIEGFIYIGSIYLFLVTFNMGWLGLIFAGIPTSIISLAVRWTYMNKKVLKLDMKFWKDHAWQLFVAPGAAGIIFSGFLFFCVYILWPIIKAPFPGPQILIPGAIMLILIAVFGGFGFYMAVISWFGIWDERSMKIFKRAVSLSGPSLFLTYPMYKICLKWSKRSPFKKQSRVKLGELAEHELEELSRERYMNISEYLHEENKKKED